MNAYRAAYELGVAQSRILDATNPYLPAELYTRRMMLAQCWRAGRLHDMPASFNRGSDRMTDENAPADLNEEVGKARDDLLQLMRRVRELYEEYGKLDPEQVDVDELGPAMNGAVAVAETIDRLANTQRALNEVYDVFDGAFQLGSRLRGRS